MKRFVFTFRVVPPDHVTVMARFGASVLSAYYSKILDQWYWSYPGGEEKIAEPQMIYVDEEYARTHQRDLVRHRLRPTRLRSGKIEQLSLFP